MLPDRGVAAISGPVATRSIVIGASTGGVEALYAVLSGLPEDCPPTFVVQHMRPNFVNGFVAGLNRACAACVVLAQDRMFAKDGVIHVAPAGDLHLVLAWHGGLTTRLVAGPPIQGHRPSVDRLFHSAAALPHPSAAALLTGMGRDGAEGMLAIRQAGGPTLTQNQATCVVFGMPRAAQDLNAVEHVLPLPAIAASLLQAAGYAPPLNAPERKQ